MRPYWETKQLDEMNRDEWEALCDGCAKCCYHKRITGDPEVGELKVACGLLDERTRRCTNYASRSELVLECVTLSPGKPERFKLMPETCAYRLLHEGKPLPEDHHLVIKTAAAKKKADAVPAKERPDVAPVSVQMEKDDRKSEAGAKRPPAQLVGDEILQMERALRRALNKSNVKEENPTESEEQTPSNDGATDSRNESLAHISHEVRTALNGIIGMALLMDDMALNDEQNRYVGNIFLSSERLLRVIDPTCDTSILKPMHRHTHEAAIDLRAMCEDLHEKYQGMVGQKGLDFKCECQGDVPDSVMGNAGWLEQVLCNLLENALKYTQQGSVLLQIERREEGKEGIEFCFQVIDTGPGIDKEAQHKIIDSNDGAGLGLLIGKKLIGLMGGHLALNSTKGEGSTFFFSLSLQEAGDPSHADQNRDSTDKNTKKLNAKVLLVEDNKVNQQVVSTMLRKAGCHVDLACNGKEAVCKLRENPPDIVLMDCQMPVENGYEATYRIRALEEPLCKVPIIAVTAHAMEGDEQRCLDSGMNDYLSKPIDKHKLIDMVYQYTAK